MKSNYRNKMQSPDIIKQDKFNRRTEADQALIKARYDQHKALAFKVGAKPMEWPAWLVKEGY
ncbi:hypothetical protein LCGC14_1125960 [marine sediment metagenome]|uniref:Uncharacterized protein n=1 Tax=marine sediment metagenome TaxID=412755 RepID=A0A0F9M7A2_9ZZZZ|nr:hypothetical protein [Methylophaga sp.]